MAVFKPFLHVERLDDTKINVTEFLKGWVYCFPKLDGTNAVVWSDNGEIHCGSRKREVSIDHDNADFMLFMMTDKSTEKLRNFLIENPNLIIYGEWLNGWSGRKQAGTIKQYLEPGFWIIAVFDVDSGNYLYYDTYKALLENIYDKIDQPIRRLFNTKQENLIELLENNHFNLPDDILGEGIVLWNYDYRDEYGHPQVAKIVAAEFLERKGTPRKIKQNIAREGLEQDIVDAFVTSADCEKCKQKIILSLGLNEWGGSGKEIGMFLNMLYNDLIQEEMLSIVKRFKNPIIDFNILKQNVFIRGRKYLGLI